MITTSSPYCFTKQHFVYHLTERKNLLSIKKNGLLTLLGKRSQEIGEQIEAIYFCDDIRSISDWIDWLYPNCNPEELSLLKFDINGLRCYIKDISIGDFYITENISTKNIYYLEIFKGKKLLNLDILDLAIDYPKQYNQRWLKLNKYPFNK